MNSFFFEVAPEKGVKTFLGLLPLFLSIVLFFLTLSPMLYSQERSLENELNDFLITFMKFSDQECRKVFDGQIVAKTVDTEHKAEVLAIGIGHVAVPRSFFIENYGKEIKPLEIHALIRGKLFSNPPRLSDLESYTLADKDLEALKNCKSGDCNIKISEEMIKRFRQEIDWEAADYAEKANLLFREMLTQYMAAYLKKGNEAMMAYGDQKYTLNMVSEFQALLASSPYLNVDPQFYSYLKNFPRETLPNVQDLFFWMEEDLGLKHSVASLNHLSFYQPADAGRVALLVNKQLYANHYFEASLGITGFVSEAGVDNRGFYLIYIQRFRIDALRRGGLEGNTIRKRLQSSIPPLLEERMSSIIDAAAELYQHKKTIDR